MEPSLNVARSHFASAVIGNDIYVFGGRNNGGDLGSTEVLHVGAPTEPPVAEAGEDIIADTNEQVTLDGSNSYDPDGEIVRYTWKRLPDEVIIYSGEEPTCQTRALGRVEEIIELTVTDNSGATATDTVKIINRIIHELQEPENHAPIADAGPDQTVYAWINGIAEVALDGSGSTDPDGDELTYTWSLDGQDIATGVSPTIELSVGEHIIELIVSDSKVDSQPDQVVITVIEAIESELWILPRTINRHGRMPRILSIVCLPEGITKDQINGEQPLLLYPGGIQATGQHVTQSQRVGIFAWFDKAELMETVPDDGEVQLQVVSQLDSGQYFYGTDTVRIISPGD